MQMAYSKEKQKVSVGEIDGAEDSLAITIQITAEKVPLSIRERGNLLRAMREHVKAQPGMTLGYHTDGKTIKTPKKAAKAS
jgi:hypothetical protein